MTTHVHALTSVRRVVNVIPARGDVVHAAAEIDPDQDVVDVEVLQRDVGRVATQVHAVTGPAGDLEAAEREPGGTNDVDGVLNSPAAPGDDGARLACGALDEYGLGFRATNGDRHPPAFAIGARMDNQGVAGGERFDCALKTPARIQVDDGGVRRQRDTSECKGR